jgi:hypothetical protein
VVDHIAYLEILDQEGSRLAVGHNHDHIEDSSSGTVVVADAEGVAGSLVVGMEVDFDSEAELEVTVDLVEMHSEARKVSEMLTCYFSYTV